MDIEKQLLHTTHSISLESLIQGHFFYNNLLTKVAVFPDTIHFSNEKLQCTYSITFDFSYEISKNGNCWVLIINCPQPLRLFSFMEIDNWENTLIKVMKRRNFHEFYRGVKKLGKGNFASVYLSQRIIDNQCFAVKAFQKQATFKPANGKEGLENEIGILRKLNHPNIAHLQGVFETENSIYLVMEFIQDRNLGDILDQQKMLPLLIRKKVIKGILSALAEMAGENIVHRDIKPDNIMITSNNDAKIVDFGLATDINAPKYLYVRCGTPGYVAPQIISIRDTQIARMATISDVFSAGTIFYQMIFGKALFLGKNNNDVLDNNRKCQINLPSSPSAALLDGVVIDSSQLALLRRMLEICPDMRITASQALKSAYFAPQTREPLKEIRISQRQTYAQNFPSLKYDQSVRQRKANCVQNKQN